VFRKKRGATDAPGVPCIPSSGARLTKSLLAGPEAPSFQSVCSHPQGRVSMFPGPTPPYASPLISVAPRESTLIASIPRSHRLSFRDSLSPHALSETLYLQFITALGCMEDRENDIFQTVDSAIRSFSPAAKFQEPCSISLSSQNPN
jgi:hypothetical protein